MQMDRIPGKDRHLRGHGSERQGQAAHYQKADVDRIRKAVLADGIVVLRAAAVKKMLNGETTFDEVIRVTGEKV